MKPTIEKAEAKLLTPEKEALLIKLREEREKLKDEIALLEVDLQMNEKNEQINILTKELNALYRSLIYIPEIHEAAEYEMKIYSNDGMIKLMHFWEKERKEKYIKQNEEYQEKLNEVLDRQHKIEDGIYKRIDEVKKQLEDLKEEEKDLIASQKAQSKEEKEKAEKILPELKEKLRRVRSEINFIGYENVYFGSYPLASDDDINDKSTYKPLEWLILDDFGDTVLLITRDCIDCHQFNPKHQDITWEKSEIRSWLNKVFINNAFTKEEQDDIELSHISTDANTVFNIDGCPDTEDKIFFLSMHEAGLYFYTNNERAASSTPYAKKMGAYEYAGASWWWLRNPGANKKFAADIHISGAVFPLGDFGISFLHGVRPAIIVRKQAIISR